MKDEKLVLCVDDDELFLRMVRSYLEAFGYGVVSETTGQKALGRIEGRRFDAAVIDYFLPDVGNGDLALEINRLHPDTAIIILTGSKSAVPTRVKRVVDAVLSKESGVEALITALDRVTALGKRRDARRFVRYSVQLPFLLKSLHSRHSKELRGTTTTLAEGGLGGRVEGEVRPGENVLIHFLGPRLKSLKAEAQVRYQFGDIYGFEFLRLGARQRARVRLSCERCLVG